MAATLPSRTMGMKRRSTEAGLSRTEVALLPEDVHRRGYKAIVTLSSDPDLLARRVFPGESMLISSGGSFGPFSTLASSSAGAMLVTNHDGERREWASFYSLLEDGISAGMRRAIDLNEERLETLGQLDEVRRSLLQGNLSQARALAASSLEATTKAFSLAGGSLVGDGMLGRPCTRSPEALAHLAERSLAEFARVPALGLARLHQLVSLIDEALGKSPQLRQAASTYDVFFNPDLTSSELLQLQRQWLEDIADAPAERSKHNREVRYLGDERIYGPTTFLRCRCGRLQGSEDRGKRCEACGVFCDDAPHRETVFELAFAQCGLVHPTAVSAIAAALRLSIDEVWSVARGQAWLHDGDAFPEAEHPGGEDSPGYYDRGPQVLRKALMAHGKEELLVQVVPITPPGDRPQLLLYEGDTPERSGEIEHPVSQAYDALLNQLVRVDRLMELSAAEILLFEESSALQRCFDVLLQKVSAVPEISTLDGWGEIPESLKEVTLDWQGSSSELGEDGDNDLFSNVHDHWPPVSILWIERERVLVKRKDAAMFYRIGGEKAASFFVGSPFLQACDDSGRYVMVSEGSVGFSSDRLFGFGCYDLQRSEWLEVLPDVLPAVTFGGDQPEDGWLSEHRRGQSMAVGDGDRPAALAWSRGNRHVLESGDYGSLVSACIRSTKSGLVVVSSDALESEHDECPILYKDGTLVLEPDESAEEELYDQIGELWGERRYYAHPTAISHLGGKDFRVFSPNNALWTTGEDDAFRLGFAVEAVAFSPDGDRLVAVTPREMLVIDVAKRTIEHRTPL